MAQNKTQMTQERITDSDGVAVESALVGEDLSLSYPTSEETIVECARLDIPQNAVTALVGPNGSGKSTLLKSLSNHLEPERGTVRIHGKELDTFDRKELARELGVLSQENDSLGSITVEDLIYHGRYPHRGFFDSVSEEDHAAVERALELAGIEDLRDAELGQLSGGQKQLAWIAMVLAQDTDVLLLDEPTTFLDVHHQFRVLETIRQLNEEKGVTVAVILHDIAQAARFADYLVAMHDGELYDWGPPEEVVTEQLLADVFGVEATVQHEPELQVLPRRALPER
ncbi:ABC transporter ATP-binding protein [Haloterrigena sp. SYSU A558-1]|uniref:Cobalamin import ATP-binding protein BtuD n=1 Tax=Haloterrigena gelatinilytica TaxID=2741724 RepID=A0A8J8GL68_9EURY|nr:ABC transporter ATP-binding protein [Haloterrigena gelatinilytica]NUB90429.1 ABC transporter ATP-binding protein [Haloterrigena gelatinilytica]NUC73753.1 ABC transporter ATP-binding protein [Haloterrigena gelatinilytica]